MSELEKALLKALCKQPCRWKRLVAVWIGAGGSGNLAKFREILHSFLEQKYVSKDADDRLSPYVVTEAGRSYLAQITVSFDNESKGYPKGISEVP